MLPLIKVAKALPVQVATPKVAKPKPVKRLASEFQWRKDEFLAYNQKDAKNIFKKFTTATKDHSPSLAVYINRMLDSDSPEYYGNYLKILNTTLNLAVTSLEKIGIVVDISEMRQNSHVHTTYISKLQNDISYGHVFKISFEYAGLVWLKRHYRTDEALDYHTLYMLKRIVNDVMYRPDVWVQPMTFKQASDQFLVKKIDGSEYYRYSDDDGEKTINPINMLGSSNVELYLMMPLLDSRFMTIHEEIYNALLNGDAAAFKAIVKA